MADSGSARVWKRQVPGLHAKRRKSNPQEDTFAGLWERQYNVLRYLLSKDGLAPVAPSKRDEQVAATVVQWLGSNVGRAFLRDAGYVRRDEVTRG